MRPAATLGGSGIRTLGAGSSQEEAWEPLSLELGETGFLLELEVGAGAVRRFQTHPYRIAAAGLRAGRFHRPSALPRKVRRSNRLAHTPTSTSIAAITTLDIAAASG